MDRDDRGWSRRLVKEAFKVALKERDSDPVRALLPMVRKALKQAERGDMVSWKEVADRVEGKVTQEIRVEKTEEYKFSPGLTEAISDILKLPVRKEEKEVVGEDIGPSES